MEQKSNVQLNSKCKIIDISQKYSCRGNPNFLFGETTQNRCGKTPERYCATGCSCLLFRWYYPDFTLLGYFKFAGTTSGSVWYLIKYCNEKIIYRKQAVDGLFYIFCEQVEIYSRKSMFYHNLWNKMG